ncbi:hypothetical protein Y032_0005g2700 [Ancylostoma ceylanicum]|uniref:Uncharacterized protein n=1 Tax=Ancylostoma ceylanicum TaxID=53326 RepID=A0A016VSL8_9BILA|nr:hypothetical protein Y032_0005g2700 [Ancylostoma ceylanicum]
MSWPADTISLISMDILSKTYVQFSALLFAGLKNDRRCTILALFVQTVHENNFEESSTYYGLFPETYTAFPAPIEQRRVCAQSGRGLRLIYNCSNSQSTSLRAPIEHSRAASFNRGEKYIELTSFMKTSLIARLGRVAQFLVIITFKEEHIKRQQQRLRGDN